MAGGVDCSVAGGTEGLGARGTRYSVTGNAEHSVAEGTGAEDAENFCNWGLLCILGQHSSWIL